MVLQLRGGLKAMGDAKLFQKLHESDVAQKALSIARELTQKGPTVR